jgi:hypothetical protein
VIVILGEKLKESDVYIALSRRKGNEKWIRDDGGGVHQRDKMKDGWEDTRKRGSKKTRVRNKHGVGKTVASTTVKNAAKLYTQEGDD